MRTLLSILAFCYATCAFSQCGVPTRRVTSRARTFVITVAAGAGGQVTDQAMIAVSEFEYETVALWSKFIQVNPVTWVVNGAGNNSGASTVYYHTAGSGAWTAQNGGSTFTYDINGEKWTQSGGSGAWSTGLFGTDLPSDGDAGVTIYISVAGGGAATWRVFGYVNDTGSDSFEFAVPTLDASANMRGICFDLTSGGLSTTGQGAGYYSMNRISTSDLRVFYAKSSVSHAQIGSTYAGAAGTRGNHQMYIHAENHWNASNSAIGNTSDKISFCAIHHGLTTAESAALFKAIQRYLGVKGGGSV